MRKARNSLVASRVERELARQKKELLKVERRVDAHLVGEYQFLYRTISQKLDDLIRLIERAQNPSTSWLVSKWQYHQLLETIERETVRFAFFSTEQMTRGQRSLVEAAPGEAQDLINAIKQPSTPAQVAAITTSFRTINPASFAHLVGNASNGKPLSRLLIKLAPHAKRKAERVLTHGIAQGLNPNEVGRNLRNLTGETLTRTQTIARTEMIRANRQASGDVYRQSKVVTGWYWQANLDNRTCFACAMMSGTVHTNEETLDGHPRCRCRMIPKTLSWAELGFDSVPDTHYVPRNGSEWFDGLTDDAKRSILGPEKLKALQSGEVTKKDLVRRPRSQEWGTMRTNASLKQARQKAARRAA